MFPPGPNVHVLFLKLESVDIWGHSLEVRRSGTQEFHDDKLRFCPVATEVIFTSYKDTLPCCCGHSQRNSLSQPGLQLCVSICILAQSLGGLQDLFSAEGPAARSEPWAKPPHGSQLGREHLRVRNPPAGHGTSPSCPRGADGHLPPPAIPRHPGWRSVPWDRSWWRAEVEFWGLTMGGGDQAELYRDTPDWKAGDLIEAENHGEGPAETRPWAKEHMRDLDKGEPACDFWECGGLGRGARPQQQDLGCP